MMDVSCSFKIMIIQGYGGYSGFQPLAELGCSFERSKTTGANDAGTLRWEHQGVRVEFSNAGCTVYHITKIQRVVQLSHECWMLNNIMSSKVCANRNFGKVMIFLPLDKPKVLSLRNTLWTIFRIPLLTC